MVSESGTLPRVQQNKMVFQTNLITLASEADALISMAQREKRTLANRIETAIIRNVNSTENSAELSAEITSTEAALASSNALLATLPDGPVKEQQVTRKIELDLRLRKLTINGNKAGAIAILESEFDTDSMERQVSGANEFIAAVTARKAQI